MNSRPGFIAPCSSKAAAWLPPLLVLFLAAVSYGQIGLDHIRTSGGGEYQIDQEHAASGGDDDEIRDYTGFLFTEFSAGTYRFEGTFLDEGVSVYIVERDDHFCEAGIANGEFAALAVGEEFAITSRRDFYIGLRTPAVGVAPGGAPAYGWLQAFNLSGANALYDHAVAYSSDGIIVGSPTPIIKVEPEPVATTIETAGEDINLSFSTESGSTYLIEFSVDMKSWAVLEQGLQGTGDEITKTLSGQLVLWSAAYYRVKATRSD